MADSHKPKIITMEILEYYHEKLKAKFVAKEAGKGLSENNFTTELKNKLDSIVSGDEYVTTADIDALFEDDGPVEAGAGSGAGETSGDGESLDGSGE